MLRENPFREQSIRDPLTRLSIAIFFGGSLKENCNSLAAKNRRGRYFRSTSTIFKSSIDTSAMTRGDLVLQVSWPIYAELLSHHRYCCCPPWRGGVFPLSLPESLVSDAAIRADCLRSEVKRPEFAVSESSFWVLPLSLSSG